MSGFDLVSIVEQLRTLISSASLPVLLALAAALLLLRSSAKQRISRAIASLFFTSWQLGLLAATGIVLSLASGWTTYIGIRNFTSEPVLAMMISFGIQGVMLIVAWLIGESFATGMSQQVPAGYQKADRTSLKAALAIMLFGIAVAAVGFIIQVGSTKSSDVAATEILPVLYWGAGSLVAIGLLIVASKAYTFRSYFDAMRVIVRTSILWVMFLACMAASVFFSFDSHFSSIFPQSERVRAAELRAQNQVGGVVADIGSMIGVRQRSEIEALFSTKGWREYDNTLTALARAAGDSQGSIEAYFVQQMESRKQSIQAQQERIATAQSSQAGLSQKQIALREELTRLEAERPTLVTAFGEKKSVLDEKQKALDAKRVEAMAEERGVEGTGKVGQGPQFRARKAEEGRLQDEIRIAQERLKDAERPLRAAESRISTIKRELAAIDGDVAKLKGEAQTAESRIKIAQEAAGQDDGPKVDPARILPSFEKLRAEFRQSPKAEHLAQIQQMCMQMISAMSAAPTTKEAVRGIDCDPKTASEAAARVFALNAGSKVFSSNCAGGDKLAQYKSVDALFDFARRCVQDSGLAGKDTDDLRQKINFIELNRDDKANRFVVTWNAFLDGNRLAYLALAIAIAVDGLIFMSGLFGANAIRSPLSDVPTSKARNAEQLEAIIDNALLPAKFENASIAIDAMHADTSRPGYSATVDVRDLDPERQSVVRKVLNAGATIGAVERDERDPARYFVRPELFEYLSIASARAFQKHGELVKEDIGEKVKLAELEKNVSVALLPEHGSQSQQDLQLQIARGAQIVLDHLHPYPDPKDTGFRNELRLEEFEEPSERKLARRALTSGSSMRLVERADYSPPIETRFVLHNDFVKVLTRLRARMLLSSGTGALQLGQGTVNGGRLDGTLPGLGFDPPARAALPEPTPPAAARPEARPRPRPQTIQTAQATSGSSLQQELVEHFAREMSLHASTIEYLVRHQGQIDVAGLWGGLNMVLRHDGNGLRAPILRAIKGLDQGIDDARQSFPNHLMHAPGAAGDVNDFADKLKSMQVVMVLLPGQAYDHLINKMEAELSEDSAAGRLDAAKQAKLKLLIEHRGELARAQYTSDHWETVQKSLLKFEHGLASLAGSDQRPTRIN